MARPPCIEYEHAFYQIKIKCKRLNALLRVKIETSKEALSNVKG